MRKDFHAFIEGKKEKTLSEQLRDLMPQDLMKFGMTPVFVGRLPIFIALDELDEETMVRILTEPKNSMVKQYKKLLDSDGVVPEFEPDALREIAQIALKKKTGARGLRAIMENVMEDIMFDIPDEKKSKNVSSRKQQLPGQGFPATVTDRARRTFGRDSMGTE